MVTKTIAGDPDHAAGDATMLADVDQLHLGALGHGRLAVSDDRRAVQDQHRVDHQGRGHRDGETPASCARADRFRTRPARSRIVHMQVTVLYFTDCPNWRAAGQRLRRAANEIGQADVSITFTPVDSDTAAAAPGFAGSPTVTVDGVDLFDTASPAGTLICRIYPTPGGFAGVPEVSDLVAALTKKVTS